MRPLHTRIGVGMNAPFASEQTSPYGQPFLHLLPVPPHHLSHRCRNSSFQAPGQNRRTCRHAGSPTRTHSQHTHAHTNVHTLIVECTRARASAPCITWRRTRVHAAQPPCCSVQPCLQQTRLSWPSLPPRLCGGCPDECSMSAGSMLQQRGHAACAGQRTTDAAAAAAVTRRAPVQGHRCKR